MYYVVTGAAGFIGSNLVKALNARGVSNIIAVDNLTKGNKYRNLVDCEIADYLDKNEFIEAIAAAKQDPRTFGGKDWLAVLQSLAQTKGTYDAGAVGQAWAILALKAAGEPVPAEAVAVLESYQLDSGAWDSAFGPDNDTVAIVLQALVAGGEAKNAASIQKALAFFETQQNDDGGFPAIKPSEWGTDTNANSTANVLMALYAVGEDPSAGKWKKPDGDPLTALLKLQTADGKVEFQPGIGSPVIATVQAIPALEGKFLPLGSK